MKEQNILRKPARGGSTTAMISEVLHFRIAELITSSALPQINSTSGSPKIDQ